jgi:hypothetical protein
MTFLSVDGAETLSTWSVRVIGDATYIPAVPASKRLSEVCYSEKGENTGLSPILPRPRVLIGLPAGVAFELSYLPPITVADATPSLLGAAISIGTVRPSGTHLSARVHTTAGFVEGPVTCARAALQTDPFKPCYGTEPSNDRFAPNVWGGELLAGRPIGSRWRLHGALGAVRMTPRFTVNFRSASGFVDNTPVEQTFTSISATLGATANVTPALGIGAQLFTVGSEGASARLLLEWRVR